MFQNSHILAFYKKFSQFFRYCVVGFLGTAIDVGSLHIFVAYLHFPILIAATFSFLLAVTTNFLLSKFWTFKNTSKNYRKLYVKFFLVSFVGLLLTLLLMYLFVITLAVWHVYAKLLTSAIVLTWNFLGNKFWTFKVRRKNIHLPEHFFYDFSIIIPAYNEENRIKTTLLLVDDYLQKAKYSAEVIVVSDGSTDRTCEVVHEYSIKIPNLRLVHYEKNQGKGQAVQTGVMESQGKYILFTDADNSTPIEELDNLFFQLNEKHADIAIGSRYLPNSNVKIKQPKYRIWMGRIGNLLIRMFLITGIKDTQCGFKLFTHQAAKEIFALQKVKRFGFDMEALVIARTLDYKIVEVPVSWFNSTESRVRPLRDAFVTLKDLVYIKLNLWSGRYAEE